MNRKTTSWKKMIGERRNNSDGFTYVYGVAKGGYKSSLSKNTIKKCIRNDKRRVRREEIKETDNIE